MKVSLNFQLKMSNPSSGDKPPDESSKDGQPRPVIPASSKPSMSNISRVSAPYQVNLINH